MTRPWRNCRASVTLINEINAAFPGRDKTSDGTIGDAAHATRTSDHNPWLIVGNEGIVRARDVDKDGIPAADIVETLRLRGAARDPRLYPGGYVIFNRRITKPDFSGWTTYTGSNPHDKHFHVSFSTVVDGFDSTAPWALFGGRAGATTAGAGPSVPASRARQEDDLVQTFEWPAGVSAHKIVCPVGSASQLLDRAWFSLACDGEVSKYDIWFQSDNGGLKEDHGALGRDRRGWWELPSGCTQIVVHVVATGPVGACLETKPR